MKIEINNTKFIITPNPTYQNSRGFEKKCWKLETDDELLFIKPKRKGVK